MLDGCLMNVMLVDVVMVVVRMLIIGMWVDLAIHWHIASMLSTLRA